MLSNLEPFIFTDDKPKLTKSFLFDNIKNSDKLQYSFIKKVQAKLESPVTEPITHILPYVNPGYSLEHGFFFTEESEIQNSHPFLHIELVARYKKEAEVQNEIQLGLYAANTFIYFSPNGLVTYERNWDYTKEAIFSLNLLSLKDNATISQHINNLTEYFSTCNGCMDYSEKEFNEAHFIKYWAEYYHIWDNIPVIGQQYLEQYCQDQTLPSIITIRYRDLLETLGSEDRVIFENLCDMHKVKKEQLNANSSITLTATDPKQLERLFLDIREKLSLDWDNSLIKITQLIRCMVIKKHLSSEIDRCSPKALGFYRQRYQWDQCSENILAARKRFAFANPPVNDTNIEQHDSIPGWDLHAAGSVDGNSLYEAVAHQLEKLNHELLKTNFHGHTVPNYLRFLVQGSKFQDGERAGDIEIAILTEKLDCIVALSDARYPKRGCVYFYTDEDGSRQIAINEQSLPNKPMIKLVYTGNHFLSVITEPALVSSNVSSHLNGNSFFKRDEPNTVTHELKQNGLDEEHVVPVQKNCSIQ